MKYTHEDVWKLNNSYMFFFFMIPQLLKICSIQSCNPHIDLRSPCMSQTPGLFYFGHVTRINGKAKQSVVMNYINVMMAFLSHCLWHFTFQHWYYHHDLRIEGSPGVTSSRLYQGSPAYMALITLMMTSDHWVTLLMSVHPLLQSVKILSCSDGLSDICAQTPLGYAVFDLWHGFVVWGLEQTIMCTCFLFIV